MLCLWKKAQESSLSRKKELAHRVEQRGDIQTFYRFATYGPPCMSFVFVESRIVLTKILVEKCNFRQS